MEKTLRPYQTKAVEAGLKAFESGGRLLICSPTGTGKSFMQEELQRRVPGSVIVSPSAEILRHYEGECMTTVKFRNRLLEGLEPPPLIIFDEAHGYTDVTSVVAQDILAICPTTPVVGFTATPYRGTPKGTEALRELWGTPYQVLNLRDAVRYGYWQMPEMSIVPLLDDDQLVVNNGEFSIQSVSDGTGSRLESLVETIRRERRGPTVVNLPSTEVVRMVELVMGDEVCTITQETNDADRIAAYERCRTEQAVLLQIRAISVGVDMPWLQTMIDARPTMSPVLWMQTFGRLTRPFDCIKRYVACNRNLERFAYLLDGLVPMSKIGEAQEAFGGISERSATASIGLEAVGRFKAIPVPIDGGVTAAMYVLQTLADDRKLHEYILLCLPNRAKPVVFQRKNGAAKWVDGIAERTWGKWVMKASIPEDFIGYKTNPQRGELSDKQKSWWSREAKRRGLDPSAAGDLERRQFCILPALFDTKTSLRSLL